jgi:hypothetical protein
VCLQGIALWLRLLRIMTLLFGALFVLNVPALVFCEHHVPVADVQRARAPPSPLDATT